MNDFEKMCKKLDEKNKGCLKKYCESDNYVCAKCAVKTYIENGDKRERLLSLSAEAEEGDFKKYLTLALSVQGALIAAMAFFFLFLAKVILCMI